MTFDDQLDSELVKRVMVLETWTNHDEHDRALLIALKQELHRRYEAQRRLESPLTLKTFSRGFCVSRQALDDEQRRLDRARRTWWQALKAWWKGR